MTADEVRDLIRERANGNQAAWAREHGMSQAYVSDVLNKRREPGDKILDALGLSRTVLYEARS